jgi:hypothetical protein
MDPGQTPSSRIFPELPKHIQEPFWYSSLQSLWIYYRVDPDLLRTRLPVLPQGDVYDVALFEFPDGKKGGLASLDLQRYTAHLPFLLATANEVEFNFYVYPAVRRPDVPLLSWEEYLGGTEQTKSIGGYRLHVPCDNPVAVHAGRGLYGEPKYLAVFSCLVPSLNAAPSAQWNYSVYQDLTPLPPIDNPGFTPNQGPLIYTLECDLAGLTPTPASPSPLIEYGVLTKEGSPHAVANFWDIWGPFHTYTLDRPDRVKLTIGSDRDPNGTVDDLRLLIEDAEPIAAQIFTSQPVSAESRGWYTVPAPASPRKPVESFAHLSAALTGFRAAELWGTGQMQPYLDELLAIVGESIVAKLLVAGDLALQAPDPTAAIQALVLEDQDLGPVARSLIMLWYLGQWTPLPGDWRTRHGANPLDSARVISADAYVSGLVWPAIGAHPMGANPGGFGSWATPPPDLGTATER